MQTSNLKSTSKSGRSMAEEQTVEQAVEQVHSDNDSRWGYYGHEMFIKASEGKLK